MNDYLHALIQKAIAQQLPFYWQAYFPSIDLRVISYTFENGKERTKSVYQFNLAAELKAVLEVQVLLEDLRCAPPRSNLLMVLEDAYWKKHIHHHPRNVGFFETVLSTSPQDPLPPA
jgi:hypothetical protein